MDEEQKRRQEVGSRIKATRQAQGLTLQKLAEESGISPGYLSEVERGLSAISGEKTVAVARVLGVASGYVLEGRGGGEPPVAEVRIPAALSALAEQLNLSHKATVTLLAGKQSLLARRSSGQEQEWGVSEWKKFYEQVKDYLPDC